ncbi:TIGR00645 family protein [Tahibacter soli]|jgi:uncharacterized protein (TIGR00645 family)|uniref:UPF0114 protein OD750_012080 n=1 Tax=Tahibacter soli TaxID=2983605 RepID=A0A9X3YM62_9GAMM|nr:TIGR00645 family protein [Tahibacter soli]MDC8013278.1 TIGR00645 family protein [Tahibacter soli]
MSELRNRNLGPLPALIFSSRWLQLPLYLGLIIAQGVYVVQFLRELWHLLETTILHGGLSEAAAAAGQTAETAIMLTVLGLIDVVMISNLLVMVIVGGYETFVSRLRLEGHPDQPEWLSHVNAAVLKVKLATAIIGISSIHLLATFIKAEKLDEKTMLWQTLLHLTFVVSAVAIAWVDRIMTPPSKVAREHH